MGLENHAPEPNFELRTSREANKTPDELRVEAQQMLAQLDTQAMKDLADPQEQEFLSALEQNGADVQEAFEEFK